MRGHEASGGPTPICSFVNVKLDGLKPGTGVTGTMGTVLLENPKGEHLISFEELINQVCRWVHLLPFIN